MDDIRFRQAATADLPHIVAMLADDPLGQTREAPSGAGGAIAPEYSAAFKAIEADANNQLIVATSNDAIIGVLQLTFIPSLTYAGGTRAQVEGVRVHKDWRGREVGKALFDHAIGLAREAGCVLVQLTTDLQRADALKFYETLGFRHSHAGMKLPLG